MISISDFLIAILCIVLLFVCFVCLKWCWKPSLADASGKTIFISGCDSGIGQRLAVLFHDLGCQVFAGCLRPENAKRTLPQGVRIIPLDITNEISVKDTVRNVKEELESLGKDLWAIINNAGVCVYGEFDWLTMDHCCSQVEVNLLGTIRVTKAFLPLIRRSKGRIVTITSVNGSVAYPGLAVYCGTKFGLEGFSDSLRLEMAKYGVFVVVVQPGDLARLTNIMASHKDRMEEMWAAMTEEDREFYDAYFHRHNEITLRNYGITSPKDFESSPLLDDMVQAVFSRSPAARYKSTSMSFRAFFWLLYFSPVSVSDALLGVLFKKFFEAK